MTYLSTNTSPIHNALGHWKLAWDARNALEQAKPTQDQSPVKGWRRDGFIRHAEEYRLLALFSLERVDSSVRDESQKSPYENTSRRPQNMLGRYDETSMRQVADLMLAFQSLSTT